MSGSHSPPAAGAGITQPARPNRLIHATSPYLQQHAHNPVDWYEWGPEALERAGREDKPIFLSIGYSACHWCHVMAHESFENDEIAAVMNRHFINIKVDREERPDLDDIYMQATLAYTRGQGGWPMSVWLTPGLKPFVAGTYFPPEDRWGRPGFKSICEQIGTLWTTRRADIDASADEIAHLLSERMGQLAASDGATLSLETIERTVELLARNFDRVHGGMAGGGTNKFPPSMALELMLRVAAQRPPDDPLRQKYVGLVTLTLDKMAAGGIYDQLAGGFARYSTDVEWLVPHFEKMLYDQALVSRTYLDAYQFTQHAHYARIAREVFEYVLADLQAPEGGFYSTRDADSEGVEGKYYVWQKPEIVAVLGAADAELFCAYYDVSDAGNWQDPHDPGTPKNILHAASSIEAVAKLKGVAPGELERRLADGRRRLLAARARRVPPGRDEKTLCEWNGLMISSLARGACVLGERRYLDAAARAAEFIFDRQYRAGRLLRSYREGRTLDAAFLSDYANLIDACIELYEATFERRWIERAQALNSILSTQYWDEAAGGYFFTSRDHERLIARSKAAHDSAVPSGNSVQFMNLLRLAALLDDRASRDRAERMLAAYAGAVDQAPWSAERFVAGVDFARRGAVEIAIIGDPAAAETRALLRVAYETYLPNRVLALLDPARPDAALDTPLLSGRGLVDGRPTAYVCRNYACHAPVTSPEALRGALDSK